METDSSTAAVTSVGDPPPPGFMVPWRWLTLILGLVTIGAVGTLVVVTSIKDLDTLSTVALALAVLSFAAQLIVTMVQTHQSSQVNADTKTALADMRATTSSLLTNQREQFDKVLHAALRTAIPAAVQDVEQDDDSSDSEESEAERANELEERLKYRLTEALASSSREAQGRSTWRTIASSSSPNRVVRISTNPDDSEFQRLLKTYPDEEEGRPVHDLLKRLPASAVGTMGKVASSLQRSPRADHTVRYKRPPGGMNPGFQALVAAGLLEEVDEESTADRAVFRVTAKGMTAIRIIAGSGPQPEWMKP